MNWNLHLGYLGWLHHYHRYYHHHHHHHHRHHHRHHHHRSTNTFCFKYKHVCYNVKLVILDIHSCLPSWINLSLPTFWHRCRMNRLCCMSIWNWNKQAGEVFYKSWWVRNSTQKLVHSFVILRMCCKCIQYNIQTYLHMYIHVFCSSLLTHPNLCMHIRYQMIPVFITQFHLSVRMSLGRWTINPLCLHLPQGQGSRTTGATVKQWNRSPWYRCVFWGSISYRIHIWELHIYPTCSLKFNHSCR